MDVESRSGDAKRRGRGRGKPEASSQGTDETLSISARHDISIQIPKLPNDRAVSHRIDASGLLSAPPTLSPTPSSPPTKSNGTPLPTIHSDEDSCQSDTSSRSRLARNDTPESSSLANTARSRKGEGEEVEEVEEVEEAQEGEIIDREEGVVPEPAPSSPTPESQPMKKTSSHDSVRRLSAAEMQQLTAAPDSLPIAVIEDGGVLGHARNGRLSPSELNRIRLSMLGGSGLATGQRGTSEDGGSHPLPDRRLASPRTLSTPPINRKQQPATAQSSPRRNSLNPSHSRPINLRSLPSTPFLPPPTPGKGPESRGDAEESTVLAPATPSIPIPPMSLPTHLQLELAAGRPSQLYIYQPDGVYVPYESAAVKMERLINVLLMPVYLERTLIFGALACLDAWLHTFTILPLRFFIAVTILVRWWGQVFVKEVKLITGFVWYGLGRLWRRGRHGVVPGAEPAPTLGEDNPVPDSIPYDSSSSRGGPFSPHDSRHVADRTGGPKGRMRHSMRKFGSKLGAFRHRRTKSIPSSLTVYNKADLLQGLVILFSSMAIMKLDASRMYHWIRGQSDIKLYVIFNLLEVGDRLLSALGQDIFECLFSSETLSRNSSGRSKILFPFGMFVLALAYNTLHSAALYFQVITLNVAVNSYSNALLTLLMSNQFVEVKGTVFKRIEKDNLFQLTCADIVERFQLWVMLLIIGMRNVVEVGGWSVPGAVRGENEATSAIPLHSPAILPHSFTVLPPWLWSGEVLSPFLIVLGSEMLVDSIKHAYVNKFNNIKRGFYGRILDILCKDYYTNAFVTPTLPRRLGLAVIPLSCLFIRASFQTYHQFLSTRLSPPLPPSTTTSLTEESATSSAQAIVVALDRFDSVLRDALGRSVYGDPFQGRPPSRSWREWTRDDVIATITMTVFFLIVFLVLLLVKLILGMILLSYSRNRYAKMKAREHAVAQGKVEVETFQIKGVRRVGARCVVEVRDDQKRWIGVDESEGLKRKERKPEGAPDAEYLGQQVSRYEMIAKRIW